MHWAGPASCVGCSQPCSHAAVPSPPRPTEPTSEGAGARRELFWTRGSASPASGAGPHPLLCSQATRTQTHTDTHTHTHTAPRLPRDLPGSPDFLVGGGAGYKQTRSGMRVKVTSPMWPLSTLIFSDTEAGLGLGACGHCGQCAPVGWGEEPERGSWRTRQSCRRPA